MKRLSPLGAVALLALPACSNDLDTLFCEPDCQVADAGQKEAPPLPALPFRPDDAVAAPCTACVQNACQEARTQCEADVGCVEVLSCMGSCSHPACIMECWGQSFTAETAETGWGLYHDLNNCAWKECPTECNAGQNWECAGTFDWPTADGNSINAEVRFAPNGTDGESKLALAGVNARACPPRLGCTWETWQRLDERNAADFVLGTDEGSNFQGYFELESEDIGPLGTHYRIHYWPLWRDLDFHVGIVSDGVLYPFGWRPSASSAALWIFANDCLIAPPTSRLRTELHHAPDGAGTSNADSVPLLELSGDGNLFAAVPVGEGRESDTFVVRLWFASELDGEESLVSERRILLRGGSTSILYMTPDARTGGL